MSCYMGDMASAAEGFEGNAAVATSQNSLNQFIVNRIKEFWSVVYLWHRGKISIARTRKFARFLGEPSSGRLSSDFGLIVTSQCS